MRSIRALVVLACTILLVTILAPAAFAASTPHPVHLVKDCSAYSGDNPSLCTVSASDLGAIPVGTKVWYTGPVLTNDYFLSSNVRLEAGNDATATGYCIFDARATESTGLCTFWAGTGALLGFTAILHVTIDDLGEWHLDGDYYFDGVVDNPLSGRLPSPWPV
jgi:hypothetical protein